MDLIYLILAVLILVALDNVIKNIKKNPDLQAVYESSIITSKGSDKNDKQKQITKKNTMG